MAQVRGYLESWMYVQYLAIPLLFLAPKIFEIYSFGILCVANTSSHGMARPTRNLVTYFKLPGWLLCFDRPRQSLSMSPENLRLGFQRGWLVQNRRSARVTRVDFKGFLEQR